MTSRALAQLRRHIVSLKGPCPVCQGELALYDEHVPWYPVELGGKRAAATPWVQCLDCHEEWTAEGFYSRHLTQKVVQSP